jgi:hypothetical protein
MGRWRKARVFGSIRLRADVSIDVVVRMAYGGGLALHYGVASEVIVHGSASLEVRASNDVAAGNGSIELA